MSTIALNFSRASQIGPALLDNRFLGAAPISHQQQSLEDTAPQSINSSATATDTSRGSTEIDTNVILRGTNAKT